MHLKSKREELGLGLRPMAELLGISKSHLERIEKGVSPVSPEVGKRIRALGSLERMKKLLAEERKKIDSWEQVVVDFFEKHGLTT